MTTNNHIEIHSKCLEMLDNIKMFELRISLKRESLSGFAGTFADLRAKYTNDIDTLEKCIKRLYDRYYKILNDLNHV